MESLAIVTDSTSDIPAKIRKKLQISMVPLNVAFGKESFLDQVTISPKQFYKKMIDSDQLPKTSQPSPQKYYETFKRLIDKKKHVIAILLSAEMSGSYQSATIAKSMLEDKTKITIINSRSASIGYGAIVIKAAEMVQAGASKEEILTEIELKRKESHLYFLLDNLTYVQKGGRIGRAASLLTSLLNIKPIFSIDDTGIIYPFEKVRSQKRAFARLCDLLYHDVKNAPVQLSIVSTPGFTESAEELEAMLEQKLNIQQKVQADLGPVIGTYGGPGTIGIVVWTLED